MSYDLKTFFRMRTTTSDIDSSAKTDLKITGYNAKAVKILFEYIAGRIIPLSLSLAFAVFYL